MTVEHTDLVVVAYFGFQPETVQDRIPGDEVQIRHVRDLASMQIELERKAPDAVLIDRWLPGDEAPGCVDLARNRYGVPALIMAARDEIKDGRLDFPVAVDGVLEKPLRGDALLDQVNRVRIDERIRPLVAIPSREWIVRRPCQTVKVPPASSRIGNNAAASQTSMMGSTIRSARPVAIIRYP